MKTLSTIQTRILFVGLLVGLIFRGEYQVYVLEWQITLGTYTSTAEVTVDLTECD